LLPTALAPAYSLRSCKISFRVLYFFFFHHHHWFATNTGNCCVQGFKDLWVYWSCCLFSGIVCWLFVVQMVDAKERSMFYCSIPNRERWVFWFVGVLVATEKCGIW
jgi:hypothetical protein